MPSFRRVASSILLPVAFVQSVANNKTFASSTTNNEESSSVKPNVLTITAPIGMDYRKWDHNWDLRAKKAEEGRANNEAVDSSTTPSNNKAVHQIVLIRHGQYDQTHTEDHKKILTELGRLQADLTGMRLRELMDGKLIHPPANIYYSTMTRATETHNIILPHLPPLESHCIKPCSMIVEGAVAKPEPENSRWQPSEESFVKNGLRVEAAFQQYFHRADSHKHLNHSSVFICHGNVIRYFVMRALQLPENAWLRTGIYNASITILEIQPNGKVSLRCMSDAGHMPVQAITSN